MSSEPLKDSFPSFHRSINPIRRAIHREEGVAGIVVRMELVGLSPFLELRFGFRHMLGRGALVLPAEQPEQRTAQVLRIIDRINGLTRRQSLLARPPHRRRSSPPRRRSL